MAAGEMGIGGVLRSQCDSDVKNSFRARTSQVEVRDTGSKKMAGARPAKIAREKIPTRCQGMALRVAVNADFRFLNHLFGQKIDDKKV